MKKRTFTEKELAGIMTMLRGGASADEPAQLIDFQPVEIEFDVDFDFSTLPPVPPLPARPSTPAAPCPGTRKISIRLPNALIQVFKDEAKRKGTRYQTLMIRVLKESSKRW